MVTRDQTRWVDTGGFGVGGMVTFSTEHGCWIYRCQWGCFDMDFESTQEAESALSWHDCTYGH